MSFSSGTSKVKRFSKNFGLVLEISISKPFDLSILTPFTTALTVSPTLKVSPFILLFLCKIPLTSPISIKVLSCLSTLVTVPEIVFPILSLYLLTIFSSINLWSLNSKLLCKIVAAFLPIFSNSKS